MISGARFTSSGAKSTIYIHRSQGTCPSQNKKTINFKKRSCVLKNNKDQLADEMLTAP
jgi:hypothetical protein